MVTIQPKNVHSLKQSWSIMVAWIAWPRKEDHFSEYQTGEELTPRSQFRSTCRVMHWIHWSVGSLHKMPNIMNHEALSSAALGARMTWVKRNWFCKKEFASPIRSDRASPTCWSSAGGASALRRCAIYFRSSCSVSSCLTQLLAKDNNIDIT